MLKLFKNLTKKEILLIIISLILIIFQVFLELKMPDYMSSITVMIQTEGHHMSEILEQGFYMLLCAGGSLISAIIVGFFAATCASSFATTIRGLIFKKVQSFSSNEIAYISLSGKYFFTVFTNKYTFILFAINFTSRTYNMS